VNECGVHEPTVKGKGEAQKEIYVLEYSSKFTPSPVLLYLRARVVHMNEEHGYQPAVAQKKVPS
jgi:hypothetical protein